MNGHRILLFLVVLCVFVGNSWQIPGGTSSEGGDPPPPEPDTSKKAPPANKTEVPAEPTIEKPPTDDSGKNPPHEKHSWIWTPRERKYTQKEVCADFEGFKKRCGKDHEKPKSILGGFFGN